MKIGVYYNQNRVSDSEAEMYASRIGSMGGVAVLYTRAEEICDVDRVLVLGGDGTILHAAHRASELNIPIAGVNYGTRGFLTEFEREEGDRAVSFILGASPRILRRSMLETNFGGSAYHCLNELALVRRRSSEEWDCAVRISVKIEETAVGSFAADGLIVATPTGSTAYSLSAGGSIVAPDCEAFLLTPVCASSLGSRPIICSDRSVLELSIEGRGELILHGDGNPIGELKEGGSLTVRKSARHADFLTKDNLEIFRRMTKKIN